MMKKPVSKFIAYVTALCTMAVMCGMPAVAFAWDDGVTKEETVYVVTDSSGAKTDVIVSDHLQNKGKSKTIADETTLTDIENVKGEETFKQKGESLTWNAEGNSIYYQGRTDAEVPVTMDITYRLDNKVVSGPELQGKSGKVEIRIHYENSAEYEGTTVPFVVMTGLIVTDDCFKNIKISKGKVIDDGEKLLVVGMAAPGLAQTLGIGESELGIGSTVIITGDAEEFAVEDMMTIVTNAFFEDIDADGIDDLDYDDEIKQLEKGAKQLADGSDQLYKGLDTLNDNMPALKKGVGQLNDGSKALKDSLKQVKIGVDAAKDGAKMIKDGMGDAAVALTDQGVAANEGAIQYIGGAEQAIGGAEQYIDGAMTKINEIYVRDDMSPEEYQYLMAALVGIQDDSTHPGAIGTLEKGKAALGDPNSTTPVNPEDPTTQNAVNYINASNAVQQGVAATLTQQGTKESPTLYDGITSLYSGLATISGGLGNESTGNTLINGAKQLADGMTALNDKSDTMANGVYKLDKGAYQLRNGMSKLYKEGIKKIVDMYNDELKGTLDDARSMLDAGKGYKTFTKLPAGMDGNVKFIYKTDITK